MHYFIQQKKRFIRSLSRILILAGVFLHLANVLHAQEKIAGTGKVFADWMVSCPDDQKCRAAQSIVHQPTNTPILQLRIFKGDKPTALFSFPLGVLLSTGWKYKIDGRKEVVLPFEICNAKGCYAGVPLTDALLSSLKRGNKLHISFLDANQKEIAPTLSLLGFTKAYRALP